MFCSKCGKEIDDSAVICVGCGCPTANYNKVATQQGNPSVQTTASAVTKTTYGNVTSAQVSPVTSYYSDDDKIIIPKIRQYISEVDSIFIISVIGIILSLGIGIIFACIGFSKIKKLPAIDKSIEDPNLIADFQRAQKKLGTSTVLLSLTLLIFVLAGLIGFVFVVSNI